MKKGSCIIQVGGKPEPTLTAISEYVDNTPKDKRDVRDIKKILEDNGHAVKYAAGEKQDNGAVWMTQDSRYFTDYLQKMYPGIVFNITHMGQHRFGQENKNLYHVILSQMVLNEAESFNTTLNVESEFDLDEHNKEEDKKKKIEEERAEAEESGEEAAPPRKPYITATESNTALEKLAVKAKIAIAAEIKELRLLPQEEQAKKEERLMKLEAAVNNITKMEDFLTFVVANESNLKAAWEEFHAIMALGEEERAHPEALNRMYQIKETLDGLETISELEKIAKDQLALSLTQPSERLDLILKSIDNTIKSARDLNNQFEEQVIPLMADATIVFHNENIDPKIQEIRKNISEGHAKRWWDFRGMLSESPAYGDLNNKRNNKEITSEEYHAAAKEMLLNRLSEMIPGRDQLIREMRNAHKDKSAYSWLFDPMMYSSEPVIQMFTKAVKDKVFEKNELDRIFKVKLNQRYTDFAGGKDESNVAKLNESMIEEVEVIDFDIDDNATATKVLSFVNPYLVDQYRADTKEMLAKYAKDFNMPKKGQKDYVKEMIKWNASKFSDEYKAAVANWVAENTAPIEDWQVERDILYRKIDTEERVLAQARAAGNDNATIMPELRLKELRKIKRRNIGPTGAPQGDYVKPGKNYINPKYTAIQQDPKKREYYNFVLKTFHEGQEMVGTKRFKKNAWEKYSYIMPSVRKNDLDRLREQGLISGIKEMLSDATVIQKTETEFGIYNQKTGELQQSVPVFYTNTVDAKNVSKDIATSLYAFMDMAHNYKAKSKLVGQVKLFRHIIKNRKTLEVSSGGSALLDRTAKKLGYNIPVVSSGESYTFKHLDGFIQSVMFGQKEIKSSIEIRGREFSANKAVSAINSYTALNALSFNLLQGVNQSIIDNLGLIHEAAAGEFFSSKSYAWGKAKYWTEGAAITDLGKFVPETKLGKALELFDALTEFTDDQGNTLVGGKLRKALRTGNLMVMQQAAEHEVASVRMLSLMRELKGTLEDSDGNILEVNGEPADLYDLLVIDKDGVMSVDERVANFNKNDFINLIQGLARRTNQTKGSFDSPMLNRVWYGKFFTLFRSWLPPGLRRRYGHGGFLGPSVHIDEELGAVTQGMYVSFFNMMASAIVNKMNPYSVFSDMTAMEKQNIRRTMTEFSSLVGAGLVIAALSNIDDDEESYLTSIVEYQAERLSSEIEQWYPIYGAAELLRIAQSPVATTRQVKKLIQFGSTIGSEIGYALGMPVDPKDIFYQRKSGLYEKGDRKIVKHFRDQIPIWRGLDRTKTPEEALKYFQGSTYSN